MVQGNTTVMWVLCHRTQLPHGLALDAILRQLFLHSTVGSNFTTGLRSQIFGCKLNCRKMSTI